MILENKYSPNNKSYIFRRNFINKIFNINLPLESNNLISDIEIAIQTYIYWNKIIEKKNPTLLIKLEELNKLNIFSKNGKKIENKIIKNNNKLYNGKRINKPLITKNDYKKINPKIKELLKDFCIKYNYNYII